MHIRRIFWGLLLLTQFACHAPNDDTSAGAEIAATINGRKWEAENNSPLTTPKAFVKNGWLVISTDLSCGVRLVLDGYTPGTYQTGRNHFAYGLAQSADCQTLYYANHKNDDTGAIILTEVNWQDSTVSGTFSFRAYNADKKETIEVKDGIFTKVPLTWLDKVPNQPERLRVEKNGRVIAMAAGKVENGGAFYRVSAVDEEGHVVSIRIPNNADVLAGRDFKAGVDFNAPLVATSYAAFKYTFEKAPFESYSKGDDQSYLTVDQFETLLPGAVKFHFGGTWSNTTDPNAKIVVKGSFEGDLQ